MIRNSGYRYFLSRFVFQVAGSWIIAPIGFLVAQALGQGANKYLYLYLTIVSLSTGCGLFLNEVLAPKNTYLKCRSEWITKSELACFSVLTLSLFFYFVFLSEGYGLKIPGLAIVFLVFSSLVSSWLSYGTSSSFCRALGNESYKLSKRVCLSLGLFPPLVSQLFVVLISLAGSDVSAPLGYILVCLTVFTPSLVQYLYAKAFLKEQPPNIVSTAISRISPFRFELFAVLTTILSMSIAVTLIKSRIAEAASSYSNLAFLALNAVATIAMISAKSYFLAGSIGGPSSDLALRLLGYIVSLSLSVLVIMSDLLLPGAFHQFSASFALLILLSVCMPLSLRSARYLSLV
jgi:hypothetical protein